MDNPERHAQCPVPSREHVNPFIANNPITAFHITVNSFSLYDYEYENPEPADSPNGSLATPKKKHRFGHPKISKKKQFNLP